jgi:hypothetical protein
LPKYAKVASKDDCRLSKLADSKIEKNEENLHELENHIIHYDVSRFL